MKAKFVIPIIISWVLIMLFISIWMDKLKQKENQKESDIYNSNLGKKILIDNDSLTIINYSKRGCTYTLSNGALINANLVNKKGYHY